MVADHGLNLGEGVRGNVVPHRLGHLVEAFDSAYHLRGDVGEGVVDEVDRAHEAYVFAQLIVFAKLLHQFAELDDTR